MYIRFSTSKNSKASKDMVNPPIEATSVTRHRSSSRLNKEIMSTNIIVANHIKLYN